MTTPSPAVTATVTVPTTRRPFRFGREIGRCYYEATADHEGGVVSWVCTATRAPLASWRYGNLAEAVQALLSWERRGAGPAA